MTDPEVQTTEIPETSESVAAHDGSETARTLPRPRIRTGAIIWGLIVAAVAVTALYVLSTPARRAAAVDWVLSLDAFTWIVVGFVVLGGFILVLAAASLIRRAQHAHARG